MWHRCIAALSAAAAAAKVGPLSSRGQERAEDDNGTMIVRTNLTREIRRSPKLDEIPARSLRCETYRTH